MIMLKLLLVLCLITGVAHAQVSPTMMTMIKPSPLGVVLTVGQWLIFSDNRRTYYIEVEGHGANPAEARDNGFRLAVEQALGTLISSETEVVNGRIKRDEIISYASGYVDRFDIVETGTLSTGQSMIKLKVWVGRSALADRLLNRSERSGEVNGSGATVQLQTLNQERVTGDRLLQQVLNDFPLRAFDIELSPTDIVRQNRAAQMEISFRIRWNQDYLRSLWTALDATSYRGNTTVSTIGVNSGSWFGFGGQARFDDMQKYQQLVSAMILTEPAVLVTVRGSGSTVLYSACYFYQEMDHQPRYNVTTERFVRVSTYESRAYVDGAYRMRSRIQIPIGITVLNQASNINLDVVTRRQCPNR
jgi:hypothetical protein